MDFGSQEDLERHIDSLLQKCGSYHEVSEHLADPVGRTASMTILAELNYSRNRDSPEDARRILEIFWEAIKSTRTVWNRSGQAEDLLSFDDVVLGLAYVAAQVHAWAPVRYAELIDALPAIATPDVLADWEGPIEFGYRHGPEDPPVHMKVADQVALRLQAWGIRAGTYFR